jgi:hypothetical protein
MKVHLVVLLLGLCGLYTASGRTRYFSLYVSRLMGLAPGIVKRLVWFNSLNKHENMNMDYIT